MEEQLIYSAGGIYSLCQLPCKCRTCGNDLNGVCGVDKGDCENAQKTRRCPVMECINWTPKAATDNVQITEYTIADMIRDLREAFREQYGIDVDIQIEAFSGRKNPHLDKERAEQLGLQMARELGDNVRSEHRKGDTARWYHVDARQARVQIALFYPNEGGCHGSGSDL